MEYNIGLISQSWDTLVGFRPDPSGSVELPDSFYESYSGRYFEEGHSLISLVAMKETAPTFKTTPAAWAVGASYAKNALVSHNSVNYRAKRSTIGEQPGVVLTAWEVFDSFAEWVQRKKEEAISRTVSMHYWASVANKSVRRVLDRATLFQPNSRSKNIVTETTYKVGLELETTTWKDLLLTIHKIGLHTTEDEELNIEVYHSSRPEVLHTVAITSQRNSFKWTAPSTDLVLTDEDLEPGGFFYIVYSQADLEGNAIVYNRDWSSLPCVSCNPVEYRSYSSIRKTMAIRPFRVPLADTEPGMLWDLDKNQYTSTVNYGLNLEFSVTCDLASIYIDNKSSFADLYIMSFTDLIIEAMAVNVNRRENRTTHGLGFQELMYILDGDSSGSIKGLRKHADKLASSINVDLSNVAPSCLRTPKKAGRIV